MFSLVFKKQNGKKILQNQNPQSPLLPVFPLSACPFLPFRTIVSISTSSILTLQSFTTRLPFSLKHFLPRSWVTSLLLNAVAHLLVLTLLEFWAQSDTGCGLLLNSPSSFCGPYPTTSSQPLLFSLILRPLACPSGGPQRPASPLPSSHVHFRGDPLSENRNLLWFAWVEKEFTGRRSESFLNKRECETTRPYPTGPETCPGAGKSQAASVGHCRRSAPVPHVADLTCSSVWDSSS